MFGCKKEDIPKEARTSHCEERKSFGHWPKTQHHHHYYFFNGKDKQWQEMPKMGEHHHCHRSRHHGGWFGHHKHGEQKLEQQEFMKQLENQEMRPMPRCFLRRMKEKQMSANNEKNRFDYSENYN